MNEDSLLRLGITLGMLAGMFCWEWIAPRREWREPRGPRWLGNLGLATLNALLLRLLFPAGLVAFAAWCQFHQLGLLVHIDLPPSVKVLLAVLALDAVIYGQHVMFHRVGVLWRLHMVHHADRDLDVSSGLRFHPLEMVVSFVIKGLAVFMLGVPVTAVLVFEVLLNAMAMFNHGNVLLPEPFERRLRLLVVTPDMHRIHHSVLPREHNSNFGFNLSCWDRMFGTYRAAPEKGHQCMTLGLAPFRNAPTHDLSWMLRLPWRGRMPQYPAEQEHDGDRHG